MNSDGDTESGHDNSLPPLIEATPEEIAGVFYRLPENHNWKFMKQEDSPQDEFTGASRGEPENTE